MVTFMTSKAKNRLEIWLSSRKGELTPATYPNVIAVEPTNLCNLSCPMCPRTSLMKRQKGLMDFSLFKKIVDESKGRTEFMYIDNMGDPLIHPKICEMIGYASKNGIRMLLGTNGAFLTGDLAACLLQNGPDLIAFRDCRTWGGNTPDYGVKQKIKPKQTERSEPIMLNVTQPCRILWNQLTVLWNGDVTPCFYDFDGKSIVGNVNKNSLAEIWNTPEMVRFRKHHLSGNYKKVTCCQNCQPMPPHGIRTFLGGMADSDLFRILIWYFQCARHANNDKLEFRLRTKAKAYKEFLTISFKKS